MEQRPEVLIAGRSAAPGEPADGRPPSLGLLADDITAAIMREVPDYAQSDDPDVARVVRRVAREAVAGLSARITPPGATFPLTGAAPPPAARPGAAVPAPGAAPPPAAEVWANTAPANTGSANTVSASTGSASTVSPGAVSPGTGPADSEEAAVPMFRDLGRLLALEGRSLGALQAALRVGARVTWQRLHEQARQGHGTPEEFARAGEAVFWYMDELAAASSAGYAEARAELAGETSQLRRHLLDLLTATSAPPLPAIAGLARASGWPLPRRVAAVALSPLAAASPGMLPPDMLADLTRRDPCLLIPDPDGPGRRAQIAAALRGWLTAASHPTVSHPGAVHPGAGHSGAGHPDAGPQRSGQPLRGQRPGGSPYAGPLDAGLPDAGPHRSGQPLRGQRPGGSPYAGPLDAGSPDAGVPDPSPLAAVGPAVPLAAASRSLRWAGQALALAGRGVVRTWDGAAGDAGDAAGVVWCEDHLPTLVLLADPDLAATLSREALAPLRPLSPAQADRLAATLLAWIESADDANAAARRLRVHPQTVRYRLRQASELFGDALTDPDARFRLLLALRVRRLLGG